MSTSSEDRRRCSACNGPGCERCEGLGVARVARWRWLFAWHVHRSHRRADVKGPGSTTPRAEAVMKAREG